MISTSEFRNGIVIIIDGLLHTILEYQHVKPGKGGAFMKTKLRRMKDGAVVEKTFRSGEKFQDAFIEKRKLQFLYRENDSFHVMDLESYDQLQIPSDVIGDSAGFLKEEMELDGQFHDGQLINIEPPMFVEVAVEETDPGLRGDTAKGGAKPAKLETGATIQVPLFVNKGDIVRVDTRTAAYVSRV